MKKILITSLLILTSLTVFASDLIIESKTQTFSDKEKKIKLDGGVKVKMDNLTVEGPKADVTVRRYNRLDTATFYDKPYAFEIKKILDVTSSPSPRLYLAKNTIDEL